MKPAWLNKKVNLGACTEMKRVLRNLGVETVCEQALCPNMGECFARSEATFLILGTQCTRMCSFCNVRKGLPMPPDPGEGRRVARAVARLGLKHVVITSVTRDDLADGGASVFAETVSLVRRESPRTTIEVLIPDFQLSIEALQAVADASPDIIAHNLETVPSLYQWVRQGADYTRSLEVLRLAKEFAPSRKTKSGLMLGMGEERDEIVAVMKDLRAVKCDFLSIGQYLAPSIEHFPVKEYITPEQFDLYGDTAREMGFAHVESAPYVRSSYAAGEYLE